MTTRTFSGSRVRKADRPMRDTARDWDWINDHADELRGQWVMVYEGRLIAADTNIRQLLNYVPQEAYPEALVTYVSIEEWANGANLMTTKTFTGGPVRKAARPLPDHKQDWDWLNAHLDELRGQWVVVRHGQLVAANPNIRQLLDKLSRDAYPDAMITYIPTEEEARRVVL